MLEKVFILETLSTQLIKVLPLIGPSIKTSFLPLEIDDYPALSYSHAEFPSINVHRAKPDVTQFFRSYGNYEPKINLQNYEEYNLLVENLVNTPEIISYYSVSHMLEVEESAYILKLRCRMIIEAIIARYYYLYNSNFDSTKVEKLYLPIENFLHAEKIYFDISIPILFIHFDIDYYELSPNIVIRKISDEAHLARYRIKSYSPAVVPSVYMSATHELVLKDYSYEKPGENNLKKNLSGCQVLIGRTAI